MGVANDPVWVPRGLPSDGEMARVVDMIGSDKLDSIVYGFIGRFVNPRPDPEEARQEALAALWEAWTRYNPGRGPFRNYASAFVFGSLRNGMRNTFRKRWYSAEPDTMERASREAGYTEWQQRRKVEREFVPPAEFLQGLLAEAKPKVRVCVEAFMKDRKPKGVPRTTYQYRLRRFITEARERMKELE